MGLNFIGYLREAHRCLKLDGHLWIAEPTSRMQNIELFRDLLFRLGFDVSRVDEKWKFTFIKAIKSERELNQAGMDSLIPLSILNWFVYARIMNVRARYAAYFYESLLPAGVDYDRDTWFFQWFLEIAC